MAENENIFDSLNDCIVFHVRDWAADKRDAWLWGIICGWDDESIAEVQAKHGWSDHATARLKRLRAQWVRLASETTHHVTSEGDK